jgi:beta-lactamase class A
MSHSFNRRTFLAAGAIIPFAAQSMLWASQRSERESAHIRLAELELRFDGRVGLSALNTADGSWLGYRASERFPLCSTFKVVLVSAILERSTRSAALMEQRIRYGRSDLVAYSPITEKHVADGMMVAELCAAALEYSDNTAANLLMKMVGGPHAVTAFARSIGDSEFRLDRWEPELNQALPGDARDSSTPEAMGRSLQRLALGDALRIHERELLRAWLRANTTGAGRIRAGVPADWQVGDKTGSGAYGTANDVAVLWPPHRQPLILAVYTTQRHKQAKPRNDIIASAARIGIEWAV